MNTAIKHFGGSFIFTICALIGAFFVGYEIGGVSAGLSAAFTAAMLGILETSLSFDNAVVNAKVLETMSLYWRRMFLTVGMIIAVFGMRIVFPLVIVWAVSDHSALSVLTMTWKNPMEFQKILIDQHVIVAGFGGAFLMMVFAKFFFDTEKEEHWLSWIEGPMSKIGKIEALWVGFTLAVAYVFSKFIPHGHSHEFLTAAVSGILTYILVEGFSALVEIGQGLIKGVSAGFASFMYLEVLDASFSFDGVIGAFAITNNLFIIALGLGIGAMFVRSLTIKLVEDKTLANYQYLEHGAFWAIGSLATIMFLNATGFEVHEVISGTIGLVLIGLSFYSSIKKPHTPTTAN